MLLEQLKQKHVKRKVKSRIQEVVTPQPHGQKIFYSNSIERRSY